MAIFISYSRTDEVAVKSLVDGLEAAQREVWYDRDLHGGVRRAQKISHRAADDTATHDHHLRSHAAVSANRSERTPTDGRGGPEMLREWPHRRKSA